MSNVKAHTLHPPFSAAFRYAGVRKAGTGLVTAVVEALGRWHRLSRGQTRIHELNDHMVSDIGLSRAAIGRGPAESFWRTHDGGCGPLV